MDTSLVQWNIRGFRTNYQHLRLLLTHTNAVVACLQECRMPLPLLSPPRGFQLYSKAGPPGIDGLDHGGVCILVKDSIGHAPLTLTTDLQAVAIRCHLGRQYTICSFYAPPNSPLYLEELEDLIMQLPAPFILAGDFNARHPLWGDSISNQKGRIVESLLGTGECCILNEPYHTHFHSATDSFSNMDLSLCSPDILHEFTWSISRDLYNSDHFPVRLVTSEQTPNEIPPRYQYDKANWACFREAATCTQPVDSFTSIDEAVEYFGGVVQAAADLAIPKTSGKLRTKPVPWWNAELQQAHTQKKIAMRRYYRTRLVQDKISFNRARSLFHFLQKKAQKQSWRNYVSTLTTHTPINKVWNMVKKIQGRYGGSRRPVLQVDDKLISDPHEVANLFAQNLSEVSRSLQKATFVTHKNKQEAMKITFNDDDDSEYNVPFSMAELVEALKGCSNTAAGDDCIHYSMLKHLPEISMEFLLQLFNRMWLEGSFPTS